MDHCLDRELPHQSSPYHGKWDSQLAERNVCSLTCWVKVFSQGHLYLPPPTERSGTDRQQLGMFSLKIHVKKDNCNFVENDTVTSKRTERNENFPFVANLQSGKSVTWNIDFLQQTVNIVMSTSTEVDNVKTHSAYDGDIYRITVESQFYGKDDYKVNINGSQIKILAEKMSKEKRDVKKSFSFSANLPSDVDPSTLKQNFVNGQLIFEVKKIEVK
uniref:SHSP domain-containing protein n=1 Tax=Romanomermis culicivorax TaxID=13658 RepID=A0A915JMK3_ROMCU